MGSSSSQTQSTFLPNVHLKHSSFKKKVQKKQSEDYLLICLFCLWKCSEQHSPETTIWAPLTMKSDALSRVNESMSAVFHPKPSMLTAPWAVVDNAVKFYSWCCFWLGCMKSVEISYSVCGNKLKKGSFVPSHSWESRGKNLCPNIFYKLFEVQQNYFFLSQMI